MLYKFKISFQGRSESLEFDSVEDASVASFLTFLEERYEIHNVKIMKLMKGKVLEKDSPEMDFPLASCMKSGRVKRITILGVTAEAVQKISDQRDEQLRLNEMEEEVESKPMPKKKARPKSEYCFGLATVRDELDNWEKAEELMMSVVNDPCLLKVLETHKWKVGKVIEITPWEEPKKLGWNRNHGQIIALRLRSGRKGFLLRSEVMETMFHELAHNDIGPHNDAFRKLNSQVRNEYNHFKSLPDLDNPEAFKGVGVRLGGSASREHRAVAPKEMARRAALRRHVELLYATNCTEHDDHDHDHDMHDD